MTAPGGRDAAYRALVGGARFMTDLAERPRTALPWAADRPDVVRARYLANCLRELDRFLHVLIDETSPVSMPALRCAATRIGALLPERTSGDRLRALGRTRACLWHCHGRVRRADRRDGEWMTAGWRLSGTEALQRYRLGERLTPAPADIADVGGFYRRLGDRLVATV